MTQDRDKTTRRPTWTVEFVVNEIGEEFFALIHPDGIERAWAEDGDTLREIAQALNALPVLEAMREALLAQRTMTKETHGFDCWCYRTGLYPCKDYQNCQKARAALALSPHAAPPAPDPVREALRDLYEAHVCAHVYREKGLGDVEIGMMQARAEAKARTAIAQFDTATHKSEEPPR